MSNLQHWSTNRGHCKSAKIKSNFDVHYVHDHKRQGQILVHLNNTSKLKTKDMLRLLQGNKLLNNKKQKNTTDKKLIFVVIGALSGRLFVRCEDGTSVRLFVRCANVFTLSSEQVKYGPIWRLCCLSSLFLCRCHLQSSSQ